MNSLRTLTLQQPLRGSRREDRRDEDKMVVKKLGNKEKGKKKLEKE